MHIHMSVCIQNFGKIPTNREDSEKIMRVIHRSTAGYRSRNGQSLKLLHGIYKSGCQWRPLRHEDNHCLLQIHPSHSKVKNQRPSRKAERRELTAEVSPSLGAYLPLKLLTDLLSVPLKEIMKSSFILIHIKIFIQISYPES